MPRLFSALQIPQKTTEEIISLQNGLPKARWINPKNFHITLSFFGEVDNCIKNELIRTFDTIKLPNFVLQTNGFKIFDSEDIPPHSVVIRIKPCKTLDLLHEQMQHVGKNLGLTVDARQFSPHITMGRLLDVTPEDLSFYLSSRGSFSFPPFEIDHFVLFSSPDSTGKDLYVVQGSWELQK
ncbi:RNA 2',3'-cyclic phosphodiesterase [Bartonella sp. B41]